MPLTLKEANAFVAQHHRHHKPVRGYRFAIGVELHGKLVGAVIIGRPVARAVDWHRTAEVTRLTTDGTKNACSILYAAAARAAWLDGRTRRDDQPMGRKRRWRRRLTESEPAAGARAPWRADPRPSEPVARGPEGDRPGRAPTQGRRGGRDMTEQETIHAIHDFHRADS